MVARAPFVRESIQMMNDSQQKEYAAKHARHNLSTDRKVQDQLLALEEETEDLTTAAQYFHQSAAKSIAKPTGTKTQATKSETLGNVTLADAFSAWAWKTDVLVTNPATKLKKIEKPQKPKGDQNWRDWRDAFNRSREISYVFKHYADSSSYIEQYRGDHTYGHGLLNKEGHQHPDQVIHRIQRPAQLRYKLENTASNWTHRVTPQTSSDSAILELQHKYKFDPSALKAASNGATHQKTNAVDSDSNDSETRSLQSQGSARRGSAQSIKETIKARSSGTVNLTPTKGSPWKIQLGNAGSTGKSANYGLPLDSPTA